jgi:Derlin-2/3
MYFLVRYSRLLEEGDFRNRPSHFLLLLMFGVFAMSLIAPYVSVHFLGSSLTFMMVYVWGRRNPSVRMSFLLLFNFTAPYLPWVMLIFSAMLGNPMTIDIVGICVGHVYYYFEYVYPLVAEIRGWRIKRVFEPPQIMKWVCGDLQDQ